MLYRGVLVEVEEGVVKMVGSGPIGDLFGVVIDEGGCRDPVSMSYPLKGEKGG